MSALALMAMLLSSVLAPVLAADPDLRHRLDAGLLALDSGNPAAAIEDHLLPLARAARQSGQAEVRVDADTALAVAYQRLGMNTQALAALSGTIEAADEMGDAVRQARSRSALGLVQQSLGQHEQAIETLHRAERKAGDGSRPRRHLRQRLSQRRAFRIARRSRHCA
jgi:tetratricopeptide (TPR) repeat protein